MRALDSIREYCLSLPGVTENVKWDDVLLFRVGGKIFAMVNLNPVAEDRIAFKCGPQTFAELLEREGARPAAYFGLSSGSGCATSTSCRLRKYAI
jgi:predicted DNA-binding protein (MmcQ/YjbR family)